MDAFNTAVTCTALLYKFLDAQRTFSVESSSLAKRFEWDLSVLQYIIEFFQTRRASDGGLSAADQELLESTRNYLEPLIERVESLKVKIERRRNGHIANRIGWPFQRKEYESLQRELFEWTQRLGLRLILLPERLRQGIAEREPPATSTSTDPVGENVSTNNLLVTPSQLVVQIRMQSFLRLGIAARKTNIENLLVERTEVRFLGSANSRTEASLYDQKVIVEYRPYNHLIQDDQEALEQLQGNVGSLAAVLAKSDPSVTFIPRCCGFFHEPTEARFGLLYRSTVSSESIGERKFETLKDALLWQRPHPSTPGKSILLPPTHPLNERFRFARDLAAAILYVHSVGWVHKNVMSSNIVFVQPPTEGASQGCGRGTAKETLGKPLLMGFEESRDDSTLSNYVQNSCAWDVNIYRHPQRQGTNPAARYSMAHDVYSLGVVLLELGLWQPLEKWKSQMIAEAGHSSVKVLEYLQRLAERTAITMGERFRDVVLFCLSLGNTTDELGGVKYISEVLSSLEDMAVALV
ncbi:hypothetical protein BGZ57DRAFT_829788 [Hyaloscypha finlandica]|nr:hypothetical protein BGZ57DRAFT_829788 [Hyaloscypha finlandica]